MPIPRSHTIRRLAVLALLCSCGAMASAQVYRCKEANGQVVISDRPCGAAFSGQPLQTTAAGTAADRLAVPEMYYGSRPSDAGRYDFIPDGSGRSGNNGGGRSDKPSM